MPSSDESIITAEAALASQSKFLPLVPHPCKRARDALTYKLPQLELSHVSKKTFYHRHQEWIGWALSPSFTGLRSVSMFCCTADECCQLMRRPLLSARRSDPDWAPETLLIRGKGSPATPLLHLERGLGRPGRHCGRPGKGGEGQYYDTGKSPQHAQGSIQWWEGGGSRGLEEGAARRSLPSDHRLQV